MPTNDEIENVTPFKPREVETAKVPMFAFGWVVPNEDGDIVEMMTKLSPGVVRNLIPVMTTWLEQNGG
jgi:hypothetical protein